MAGHSRPEEDLLTSSGRRPRSDTGAGSFNGVSKRRQQRHTLDHVSEVRGLDPGSPTGNPS